MGKDWPGAAYLQTKRVRPAPGVRNRMLKRMMPEGRSGRERTLEVLDLWGAPRPWPDIRDED